MKLNPVPFHTSKITYCRQLNPSFMSSWKNKLDFCDLAAQGVTGMDPPVFAELCRAPGLCLPAVGSSQRSPRHRQLWLFWERVQEDLAVL